MKTRIKCIFHAEETPSLVIYDKTYKCFGCGKHGLTEELPENLVPKEGVESVKEKEDLQESIRYICSLPKERIRGLDLHANKRGYFIVWPDHSYYKLRLYDPTAKAKYIGAKGYAPGMFWAKRKNGQILYLLEGEINALTLAECIEGDVASLCGTSSFNAKALAPHLPTLQNYAKIVVILDDDKAGLEALQRSREYLLYKVPFVEFLLIKKPDINDRFVSGGKEEVWRALQRPDFRC